MLHINFYTKEKCSLCDHAVTLLSLFQKDYPHEIERRDIYSNDKWLEQYHLLIPVLEVNGKQLNGEQINYDSLEQLLKEQYEEEIDK
ncbi:glutaredoxin family protein [Oceanobacillus salinisoli]|uniref:glutaredoxin family protein n=1 Tax=Oceanobacillus salinisoli TaxID=2678611 RepID=UPI0012E319A2|nr:glutaredoxin family protein [Oceanobacillus salinisoli]